VVVEPGAKLVVVVQPPGPLICEKATRIAGVGGWLNWSLKVATNLIVPPGPTEVALTLPVELP
jgi:hypothetical protein